MSDQDLIKLGQECMTRFKAIIDSPDWVQISDNPCLVHNLKVEGTVASKGETIVKRSIDDVFDFLKNRRNLMKINDKIKEYAVLYEVPGKDIFVERQVYHGVWPVSERDFVSMVVL